MKHLYILFYLFILLLNCNNILATNKYYFNVNQPFTLKYPHIDIVTVENESIKLIWTGINGKNIVSYNVYRSFDDKFSNWEYVGSRLNDGNFIVFYDLNSNPASKPVWYKISTINKCNEELIAKTDINTIHLTSNLINLKENYLSWNKYFGSEVDKYYIYKGTDKNQLMLIDSVTSNQYYYIDTTLLFAKTYYKIVASGRSKFPDQIKLLLPDSLSTYKNEFLSESNLLFNSFDSLNKSIKNVKDFIYPVPLYFNSTSYLKYKFEDNGVLQLIDLFGNVAYSQELKFNSFIIPKGNLNEGIFILRIIFDNKIISDKITIFNK
jgi:hypothetical protein